MDSNFSGIDRRQFLAGAGSIALGAALGAAATSTAFASEKASTSGSASGSASGSTSSSASASGTASASASASAAASGSVVSDLPWGEASEVTPFVPVDSTFEIPSPQQVDDDKYAKPDASYYAEPTGILKDKVALVTGASSGSGREIARLFAREGAKVVGVARRADRLQALMEESKDYDGEIAGFKADLSDRGQVQQMVEFALDTYGKIDILINDAGVSDGQQHASTFTEDLWDYVFALNLDAPVFATKYALASMLEQGKGVIVNISSIGGKYGPIGGIHYSSTKAALLGFTRNTGYIYQTKGIRCNAICPGGFESEIGNAIPSQYIDEDGLALCEKYCTPRQYYGKPQEVANIALFLASDASSFINAQEVVCDGAWTAGQ